MKHIWRIIRFSGSLWRYYLAISLLTILISLSTVITPLLSGWAIDEIRRGSFASVSYVVWLAFAIFGLDIINNILNNYNGFLGDQLSAKLNKLLSVKYFEHLLELPQSFFDKELTGKLTNRLGRSVQQISNFMQTLSNNFAQFIFSTIFALIIVAYFSWQVALMLLLLYPLYTWLTVRSSDKWQKYQAQKNDNYDIANGRFTEAIGQIKVIKSYIQEKRELRFFNGFIQNAVAISRPQSSYWHWRDIRRRLLLNIIFLGVYSYIFVSAVHGSLSPGQAVALILYAQQIRIPIFTISFLVDNTQRAIADSKDYFEIMDFSPDINDLPDAAKLDVKAGQVVFNDVHFSYDKSKVLKGVSFEVKPNSKVALVGESGEGKTTITNLLMRLYEVDNGAITIDGQNIAHVTQKSLHNAIGVVFQEPALFSGTISENISYADPAASEDKITAAAKAANAHEFITGFEKGYDSEIGERGLKLSGGQKQRIAIARAILKDAPILVLDEATSSLDSRSEVFVHEALENLMRNRTTIIIAHRLSTIQHVNQIITINGGKVEESGRPQDLENSGGIYDQLLALQNRKPSGSITKRFKQYDISG